MQDVEPDQNVSSRRDLIVRAIIGIPVLIGGSLVASIGSYLFGKQRVQPDDWADAGDVSDVQVGTPRQIRFERAVMDGWKLRTQEVSAWVIRDARRQVTAFSPLCTHLGCAYRWQTEKKSFVCPCHGSEFDIRGEVTTGPATRPLDRYVTKIEGDRLWLGPLQAEKET